MAKGKRAKRAFGNVYERIVAGRSIGWYVRWSVAGRRYHRLGGRTRALAEAYLARLSLDHGRDLLEGRTSTEPITLARFRPRLEALWTVSLRKLTVETRRAILAWAAKALPQPMRDVSAVEAEAVLLAAIRDGLAISTAETRRSVLRSAWSAAMRLGLVRENPWRGVKLPRRDQEADRVLTTEQLDALYAAARAHDPRLGLAVVLMGETGLRRAEALNLTWRDVAPDRSSVTVRGEVAKSHRYRVVPLSAVGRGELERAWRERPGTPDARVVGWSPPMLNKHFRLAADAVGLTDVTPHTLRHSVGHALGDSGLASTIALRDLLGHSSIRTTERYMGRASRKAVEGAVEALAALRHADSLRDSTNAKKSEPST